MLVLSVDQNNAQINQFLIHCVYVTGYRTVSEMTDTMEVEMETATTKEAIDDASSKEEPDESGPHKPRSRLCMLFCNAILSLRGEKNIQQQANFFYMLLFFFC